MTTAAASATAHITGWDRAVIIALGGAGCALSYDALQQMAVAIHVRGFLTYLFPLVIDGFIAYGVRALLVLRNAPLRARLYVWTLFGTATAASIWANALHAVRLNQQTTVVTGLRLGDTVVAVLSTLAPLALAGAVHLYILIARRAVTGDSDRGDLGQPGRHSRVERNPVTRTDQAGRHQPAGQVTSGPPDTAPVSVLTGSSGQDTHRLKLPLNKPSPDTRTATRGNPLTDSTTQATPAATRYHDPVAEAADLGGQPVTAPTDSVRPADADPVTGQPDSAPPVTDRDSRSPGDRRSDPDTEELLKIARAAVRAEDKLTRKVVAQAIRGQKIPLSNDTLTALMVQLREQHGQPVTASRN